MQELERYQATLDAEAPVEHEDYATTNMPEAQLNCFGDWGRWSAANFQMHG